MSQAAVAGSQSRIGSRRNRVTFYEEQDVEPVTDAEIDELCRQSRYKVINLTSDEIDDLIDRLDPIDNRRVFM